MDFCRIHFAVVFDWFFGNYKSLLMKGFVWLFGSLSLSLSPSLRCVYYCLYIYIYILVQKWEMLHPKIVSSIGAMNDKPFDCIAQQLADCGFWNDGSSRASLKLLLRHHQAPAWNNGRTGCKRAPDRLFFQRPLPRKSVSVSLKASFGFLPRQLSLFITYLKIMIQK